jgi:CheY-like chemotaxis protein
VSVQANLDTVHLRIRDTGVGIDAEFMPHLFEEFKQESTGLARSYEGSGLGLSITRRLVYLAGGTIEVESTKGQGTTFVVVLPRYTFSQELSHRLRVPASSRPSPEPRMQVLLVEDNEEAQDLVRRMLDNDCVLEVAPAAEAARALLMDRRYDIILLNVEPSGDADGTEMLRVLRSRRGFEHLPVVALTTSALPGDRERFLRQGFDEYLCKPFSKQQLLDVISSAVEHV